MLEKMPLRIAHILCLIAGLMAGAGFSFAGDSTILSHAGDYTFGFYPEGWRQQPGRPGIRFAVQTNRYAALFDAGKACFEAIAPVAGPLPMEQAAAQGNELLEQLPRTPLSFAIEWNGHVFPVTAGTSSPDHVRLYQVGKYLQHFSAPATQFGGVSSGAGLEGVSAWVDGYCWSERMAVEMQVDWRSGQPKATLERRDVVLSARLGMFRDYPVVEALDADGRWQKAGPGAASSRAMLMRNAAGAGVALICVPGQGQQVRQNDASQLLLSGPPSSLTPPAQQSFACILVPSAKVAQAALGEVLQMEAALQGALQVTASGIAPYTDALPVSYDPVRGWWQVLLGENPDPKVMDRVRFTLNNATSTPATARLNFAKVGGGFSITGMSPVVRNADGAPLGLPVQISKNWHCNPPWFYGLTEVEAAPGAPRDLEFDLAYGFWGSAPAVSHAQLCLVGYASNQLWDEMAIGSFGESICYDPDVNLGRSLIDDMRPLMVWGMGKTPKLQWSWTHNVGGGDFLVLFPKERRERQFLTRQKTLYKSYGPVMTDVTYAGQTPDGAIQSRVRTQTWRADDYVRALYTLRYDVVKPVENIGRLAFFQLGADHYNDSYFQQLARGSAAGLEEAWEPARGGWDYSRRGEEMTGPLPWVGVYGIQRPADSPPDDDQGARANKAMIVRDWQARLGGKDVPLPRYSIYGTRDGRIESALVELSPPKDLDRLEAGDFVEARVEMLILPQKAEDYYGPNQAMVAAMQADTNPWALTLREAQRTQVAVTAAAGAVEQTWPVRVRAENGAKADFTVTGGVGHTPVTITGVRDCRGFTLQQAGPDVTLKPVDQSSAVGDDWWQSDYDPATGEWAVTCTLPLDTPGPQRFIWELR